MSQSTAPRHAKGRTVKGQCAKCGAKYNTPRELIGQRLPCPKCGNPLTVEMPVKVERSVRVELSRQKEVRSRKPLSRPSRKPVAITGRYDFHYLVAQGYLPPPTPEMVGDLRGKGLYVREKYPVRLGELIARVTHFLGIPMCSGCSKRRMWLNRLPPVWGWWRMG